MEDAERMSAWLREAALELDKAHGLLDEEGVPRYSDPDPDGTIVPMTLALRIETAFQMIDNKWMEIA